MSDRAVASNLRSQLLAERAAVARLHRLVDAAVGAQTAESEDEIFRAIGAAIVSVDLNMHVTTVDPAASYGRLTIVIRHIALADTLLPLVERLIGRPIVGIEISADDVHPYPAVLREGRVVVMPDAGAWLRAALPWLDERRARALGRMQGLGRAVGAPLTDGREIYGALSVWGSDVSDADTLTVRLLGRLAGAAVANLRLHTTAAAAAQLDGAVKTARLVAHELNNDLGLILGYVDVLRRLPAADQADTLAELAQVAREAAETVARLQNLVRFREVDTAAGAMLDLEGATDA